MNKPFQTLALSLMLAVPAMAHAATPLIEVYKTASCGCCKAWIKHLEANGFSVKANDVADTSPYRHKFGIASEHGSCHSAKIGAYAIEGHVPASEIKRLVASGVKARGLAVPGMPAGSPGMESPQGEPYDVLLVQADGKTSVYRHYTGKPDLKR